MNLKAWAMPALPAATLLLGLSGAAAATEIYDPSISTCTGADCSSVLINGTVTNPQGNDHAWVMEAFARAGECLRLHTLSQAVDLEMTVSAPNGNVYRNDDGGGTCATCSLVKLTAPNTGWYTVQMSQFAGVASYSDFQLAYGRYAAGNPNCAAPTTPAFVPLAAAAKPGGISTEGLGDRTGR